MPKPLNEHTRSKAFGNPPANELSLMQIVWLAPQIHVKVINKNRPCNLGCFRVSRMTPLPLIFAIVQQIVPHNLNDLTTAPHLFIEN